MPPSQLKALKASLHEKGILGQQRSKKKHRQAGRRAPSKDDHARRASALQFLREQFNPFEVKQKKQSKHAFFNGDADSIARPGLSKAVGEDRVSHLGRNNKVGHPLMFPQEEKYTSVGNAKA